MAKLKLSPPWIEYYEEVRVMFNMDPDVHVVLDDEEDSKEKYIKIYVESSSKAAALQKLLQTEKDFGGVKLLISVIPSNSLIEARMNDISDRMSIEDMYIAAFNGNPVFSFVRTVEGVFGFTAAYVVFAKIVLQFFDDNLSDIHGMKSMLAENVARDIFNVPNGVFFCTDVRDINTGYPFIEQTNGF